MIRPILGSVFRAILFLAWIAAVAATIATKAGLMPQLSSAVSALFWLLVLAPALLELDARFRPWHARRQALNALTHLNLSKDSTWQALGITVDRSLGETLPKYVARPDVDAQLDEALAASQAKTLNNRRPVVVVSGERGTGTSRTLYESIARRWPHRDVVVLSSGGELERLLDAWPPWRSLPVIWCLRFDKAFADSLRSNISRIRQGGGVVVGSLSDMELAGDFRREAWASVVQHSPLLLADLAPLIGQYPSLASRLREDGVAALAASEPDPSDGPRDLGSRRVWCSGRDSLNVELRCSGQVVLLPEVAERLYESKKVAWAGRMNDPGYSVRELRRDDEALRLTVELDRSDYVRFQAINIALGVAPAPGSEEDALRAEFDRMRKLNGSNWDRPLSGFANAPSVNFLVITSDDYLALSLRGGTQQNIRLYPNCVSLLIGETLSWSKDGGDEPSIERATRRAFEEELGLALEQLMPVPTRPASSSVWSYYSLLWNTQHYYLGLVGLAKVPWSLDQLRANHAQRHMPSEREIMEVIGIPWSPDRTPVAVSMDDRPKVPGLLLAVRDGLRHYFASKYWLDIDQGFMTRGKQSSPS